MAKHRSQKRRSHSKRRTRRHRQHGGNYPPSAWGSVMGTVGDGWTQFQNALMLQPGENLGAVQSNAIVPIGNPNAQTSQGNIGPNMTGNVPGQLGGRRRRRKSRGKRGGNLLAVAQQAAVPVALIAMNNAYGKRRRSRSHRRR